MKFKCHQCGFDNLVNPGELLRSIESEKRRKASRANGKKGGRPRKKPGTPTHATAQS